MFRSFGPVEILLILGVVLLVFGASRLPQMGLSLGKGLRQFKRGITTGEDDEPAKITDKTDSTKDSGTESTPSQH